MFFWKRIFRSTSCFITPNNFILKIILDKIDIPKVKDTSNKPRSFFDKLNEWARAEGAAGLGYINYIENEFNNIILEDGYASLFNFRKLKEVIKTISSE